MDHLDLDHPIFSDKTRHANHPTSALAIHSYGRISLPLAINPHGDKPAWQFPHMAMNPQTVKWPARGENGAHMGKPTWGPYVLHMGKPAVRTLSAYYTCVSKKRAPFLFLL